MVTGTYFLCYLEKLVEPDWFAYAAICAPMYAVPLMVFAIDLKCVVFLVAPGFVETQFCFEASTFKSPDY